MRISDWSSDVCSSDLRSARIEADGDDRHIALRIKALLRVDQLLAIDHHLAPQHFKGRAIALAGGIGNDLAADRRPAGGRGRRVGISVDHPKFQLRGLADRSEEHTSELQSLMRISYAVFCLKKKN